MPQNTQGRAGEASAGVVTVDGLNRQVKRNHERFPAEFMFQLTTEEKEQLVTNWHRFKSAYTLIPLSNNLLLGYRNRRRCAVGESSRALNSGAMMPKPWNLQRSFCTGISARAQEN
jgi:hypothetical protein